MGATTAGEFVPRDGALRYFDEDMKIWREANPRDPWYSTVTIMATEFWQNGKWNSIWDDVQLHGVLDAPS